MTTATETPIETLIERTPGILGGRPRLAGSRISIRQIGVHYTAGETPEQILDSYPHLDLARIHAGIAYYLVNRERIDAEIAEEEALYRAGVAEAKRLRAAAR
jgi:uncharacterized protein (DUF433 family)